MRTKHDTPSAIAVENGEIHVDGPDGRSFSFTPVAALETGQRLIEAAIRAQAGLAIRRPD
jgi:hypothetical protein